MDEVTNLEELVPNVQQQMHEQWIEAACEEFEQLVEDKLQAESFDLEVDFFDDQKQEDKLWQAKTGLTEETLCGAIETIIFMSDKPISIQKIKSLIDPDLPLRVVYSAIETLQSSYEVKTHGIRLVEVAQGYQFRTKATFSKYVQDLFKVTSLTLTPAALEVLAIIAYKQPISKSAVAKIRGVDSSHLIKALMDKRLVKTQGRSQELGHPTVYATTPEFLEVFNLATIEDLPAEHELEDIITQEDANRIPEIKTIVRQGDKKAFMFDEMDELESLAQTIKSITADTAFTKNLKLEEKKRVTEEGTEVKSAFELLEQFVDVENIKKVNAESVESEAILGVGEPKVISDLAAGPFNTPEADGEDFQMVDLETGEVLEPLYADVEALDEELSAAFARLKDDFNSDDGALDMLISDDDVDAQLPVADLELSEEVLNQAEELDIDLSFMQTEEKNTDSLPTMQ